MAVSHTHHFIFRHGEAAALGAGNWLLGVVFALLEVVGERVQLDHHRAAVQLIVTPASHTCHVSRVTGHVSGQSPYFQATEQVLEDPGHGLQLRDGDAAPVHWTGLLPVEPLHDAVRAERMLAPAQI